MKGVVCIVKDCKFSKVQKNCDVKFFKIPSGSGNMDRRAKWMEWLNKVKYVRPLVDKKSKFVGHFISIY